MLSGRTIRLPYLVASWSLLLLSAACFAQQPKVTTLEKQPSKRSAGIISLPNGSPWCLGRPTIWLPGHKDQVLDRPNCFVGRKNDRRWRFLSRRAVLDVTDRLNRIDNQFSIDRHECGVIDANNDGIMDLYCMVGANRGTGVGFNELYLTNRNGTVTKVLRHGLQRFTGVRTRHTAILKGFNGTEYVFLGAAFGPRPDGKPNLSAMFRKTGVNHPNPLRRYFEHVTGPWRDTHLRTSCSIATDVNNDGLDDLVLCNENGNARLYVQTRGGRFRNVNWSMFRSHRNFRSARIADMNGDGMPDLVTVKHGVDGSLLSVHLGTGIEPYFLFREAWYTQILPFAAPDIEVFDVDGDGALDIYVVQVNETKSKDNYCNGRMFDPTRWWNNPKVRITPPRRFVPPRDRAPDLLLKGNPRRSNPNRTKYFQTKMRHREPGCGHYVKKFGEKSLVLAQGGFVIPGHQLLLEWQ